MLKGGEYLKRLITNALSKALSKLYKSLKKLYKSSWKLHEDFIKMFIKSLWKFYKSCVMKALQKLQAYVF